MAAICTLRRGYAYNRSIIVWLRVSGIRADNARDATKMGTYGESYSDHEDLIIAKHDTRKQKWVLERVLIIPLII